MTHGEYIASTVKPSDAAHEQVVAMLNEAWDLQRSSPQATVDKARLFLLNEWLYSWIQARNAR